MRCTSMYLRARREHVASLRKLVQCRRQIEAERRAERMAPPGALCGVDGWDAKPRPTVHLDPPLLRFSPGPPTFGSRQ